MKTVGIAEGALRSHRADASQDHDLLSALAGKEAGREGVLAFRTRRVVLGSLGLMQEQKAGRKRSRGVALAGVLLILMAVGPFVWRVVDDLISGEHLCDQATQFSLLICVFCLALVAAVLVAGWARRNS